MFVHFNSTEDGEKNDQYKAKELLIEPSLEEEKKPPKRKCGQKKEQPEAMMASFFAGLDIYQTKILVSHFSIIYNELVITKTFTRSLWSYHGKFRIFYLNQCIKKIIRNQQAYVAHFIGLPVLFVTCYVLY